MSSPRVLVAIPMYNCAPQIGRVLAQFTPGIAPAVAGVLVVDNRSTDGGFEAARAGLAALAARTGIPGSLTRNDDNYGLGGSHKVAFAYAMARGYDWVVILHGDDQGTVTDLLGHVAAADADADDVVLGGRFMRGSALQGYSWLRTVGNRSFNLLLSAAARRAVHDLGSGLNGYRVASLRTAYFARFPDDLTFNVCMVMAHAAFGHAVRWVPISWREDDQRSSVRLARQAWRQLMMVASFARDQREFLARELRAIPRAAYPSTLVVDAATIE